MVLGVESGLGGGAWPGKWSLALRVESGLESGAWPWGWSLAFVGVELGLGDGAWWLSTGPLSLPPGWRQNQDAAEPGPLLLSQVYISPCMFRAESYV